MSIVRTVVSGNGGQEVEVDETSTVLKDENNVYGQNGQSGVVGFTPSPSSTVPAEPAQAIVNPETGALVPGSPAIDAVTDGTCTTGIDGNGDGGQACDIGADEFGYGVTPAPVAPAPAAPAPAASQPQPEPAPAPAPEPVEPTG